MNFASTLSASLEDYLESIFSIIKEKQVARVKDIARDLQVKSGSVTGALKALKEKALINYQPYKYVTLTKEGRRQARAITKRHRVLRKFFINVLSAKKKIAEKNACEIEHAITEDLFAKLLKFSEFVDNCPVASKILVDKFKNGCECIDMADKKSICLESCLKSLAL